MLHRFSKAFFFTSLVITALIAVTVMFGDTSRIFINMFTNGYGEIPTDIAAFFPIGATVLCVLSALLIAVVIRLIQKNKTIAPTPPKKNFFFFYFISLTTVSLLVLFFYLLRSDMYDRCIDEYDVIVFALLYGACVIEAVVLAAFFMSFFTLWKTNKPVASIIGVIITLIVLANIISGQAIYEASSRCNASYRAAYNHNNNADSSYYDFDHEVVVADDYDNNENVIKIIDDYLSFLWDEDDNIDTVSEYLFEERFSWYAHHESRYLLSEISSMVYMLRLDEEEWSDYIESCSNNAYYDCYSEIAGNTLRKIYHYLIKNPSKILDAFYSYQDVICRYMPSADALLLQLYVAHSDLYSDDDLSRLRNIYKLMTNIKHELASEYYHNIKPHINDDYLSYFYDKDGDLHQGGVVWAYSFWARRNAEGTDDIAYRVLLHLNEHYIEAEYYEEEEEEYEYEYDDEE